MKKKPHEDKFKTVKTKLYERLRIIKKRGKYIFFLDNLRVRKSKFSSSKKEKLSMESIP